MVNLIGEHAMRSVVAHQGEVHDKLKETASEVEARANAGLAAARGTTSHRKIDQARAHETTIGTSEAEGHYGSIDYEVYMEGDNPMAEEFGHAPSGYFDPEKYGKVTKAPHGLYILTRASGGLGDLELVPAMGRGN